MTIGDNSIFSEWSDSRWGGTTHIPKGFNFNELVNFSLVLDLTEVGEKPNINGETYSGYKLSLYENGTPIMSSYLNTEQWTKFKENCTNSGSNSFFLGSCRNSIVEKGPYNDFVKMALKNCRFYTRPLSDTEIKLNYDTRLAYDENN